MVILGIDPGFAIVGFGVLQSGPGVQSLVSCGAITTQAGLPLPTRLLQIENDMAELLETFHPDAMAVEELFFNNNITTGIGVAQARGCILASAERAGVPIFEYSPSEVKLAITGYGKAEKRQVMDMVKRLLKLKSVPKPDDAADAVAIALCHARSHTSRLQAPDAAKPGSGRYAVRDR
jgi:crossover junction endodeoxyribonuclease RuvC